MTDKFVVIIPTFNRAHRLVQTLDSVLGQTDSDFIVHLLDDGSTDGTPDLGHAYSARDKRIRYHRFPANRGGVAMNELGMTLACEEGAYWTRLGSDDWWLPDKLALDRIALEQGGYGACFGPYRNEPVGFDGELNVPSHPRAALLRGEFAASWANLSVRVEVLRQVRQAFGAFCDPRLRNMEDYLFNTRMAKFTEIAWRARRRLGDDPGVGDGSELIVGATRPDQVPWPVAYDARYRVADDGASYSPQMRAWLTKDARMTEVLRGEDAHAGVVPVDLAPPSPVVFSAPCTAAPSGGPDPSAAVKAWYDDRNRWTPQGKNAACLSG